MSTRDGEDGAEMPEDAVTEEEARETAGEILVGEGRVGALVSRAGGSFVFSFHPYPGASTYRAAAGPHEEDGLPVLVTPLDGGHVRVQVSGVTVSARARVRR